jgi:hypothetical protein
MKGQLPVIGGILGVLVLVAGFLIWQKSQAPVVPVKTETPAAESSIQKVDLNTQPEWVQKLTVTGKKGRSGNSLDNFTLSVSGISSTVSDLTYIVQYQTASKGVQGALGMTPQKVTDGKFSKVIDLGTCSTKSCVRHDGVTSVEVELDFNLSDGSKAIWTGSVSL